MEGERGGGLEGGSNLATRWRKWRWGKAHYVFQTKVGQSSPGRDGGENPFGSGVNLSVINAVDDNGFFWCLLQEVGDDLSAGGQPLHLGQVKHHVVGPKGDVIGVEILAGASKVR